MSLPIVFVSYSHKDEAFLDELLTHIRPLERRFDFKVWSDRSLDRGEDWQAVISATIEDAAVAVVLISADYLASNWTNEEELPALLAHAEAGDLRILPVLLRPSAWAHSPLAYYQALPGGGRALSDLEPAERDRVWLQVAEEVAAALYRLEEQPAVTPPIDRDSSTDGGEEPGVGTPDPPPPVPPPTDTCQFFISHAKEDGDFAEILKFRMKEAGWTGWIDVDVLEAGTD